MTRIKSQSPSNDARNESFILSFNNLIGQFFKAWNARNACKLCHNASARSVIPGHVELARPSGGLLGRGPSEIQLCFHLLPGNERLVCVLSDGSLQITQIFQILDPF